MHYLIEDKVMVELERAASRLESMGTILTELCGPDRKTPDLSSLADLGSIISRQSMELLELLAEKLRIQPLTDFQTQAPSPKAHPPFTSLCFVPEIPSD